MNPNEELTAPQASKEFGVHRATTSRDAKAGKVQGARLIGPVWVATRASWQHWHANRRPPGPRPREGKGNMVRIAEERELGNGLTAVVTAFQPQTVRFAQGGAEVVEHCVKVWVYENYVPGYMSMDAHQSGSLLVENLANNIPTPRELAESILTGSREHAPTAPNRLGGAGAVRATPPTPQDIAAAIARTAKRAQARRS